MVDRRELISVLRQIGIMMGAGVDFLQITAVLRAQTEDARLLRLYHDLDHDLTMGVSLADAMARQPDIFSPFAVSLVRQIEMRNGMAEMANDLSGAFLKIADYLQQDAALPRISSHEASNQGASSRAGAAGSGASATTETPPPSPTAQAHAPLTNQDLERLVDNLQVVMIRVLLALALLGVALAGIWWSFEAGLLEPRWRGTILWSVVAAFLGGAGLLVSYSLDLRRASGENATGDLTHPGQGADSAPAATLAAATVPAITVPAPVPAATGASTADANGDDSLAAAPTAVPTNRFEYLEHGIHHGRATTGIAPEAPELPQRNWADMHNLEEALEAPASAMAYTPPLRLDLTRPFDSIRPGASPVPPLPDRSPLPDRASTGFTIAEPDSAVLSSPHDEAEFE